MTLLFLAFLVWSALLWVPPTKYRCSFQLDKGSSERVAISGQTSRKVSPSLVELGDKPVREEHHGLLQMGPAQSAVGQPFQ